MGEPIVEVEASSFGSGPTSSPLPVREHLKRLIAVVQSNGAVAQYQWDGVHTVLLDIVLGGVRYTLVSHSPNVSSPAAPNLSPRELEIARMVAKGLTNKNIARVLDISLWTVSTHLRRIFAKLGVTTRAAMVARVLEADVSVSAETGPLSALGRGSPDTNDLSAARRWG